MFFSLRLEYGTITQSSTNDHQIIKLNYEWKCIKRWKERNFYFSDSACTKGTACCHHFVSPSKRLVCGEETTLKREGKGILWFLNLPTLKGTLACRSTSEFKVKQKIIKNFGFFIHRNLNLETPFLRPITVTLICTFYPVTIIACFYLTSGSSSPVFTKWAQKQTITFSTSCWIAH